MSTALLVIDAQSLSVSVGESFAERKEQALTAAAVVPDDIETEREHAVAVRAQLGLHELNREIEKTRVIVKEPFWKLCGKIDAAAAAAKAELQDEHTRLSRAIGNYQERERERARAEARERARLQDEIDRRAREAAEAALAASKSASEAQDRLQEIHEMKRQEEQALPPVQLPATVTGQAVRDVWLFEVTDIHELYRTNPGLVRLEPCKAQINSHIKSGITSIPGLRIWREVAAGNITQRKSVDIAV